MVRSLAVANPDMSGYLYEKKRLIEAYVVVSRGILGSELC